MDPVDRHVSGRYEHHKGGIYDVLLVATHSETHEQLVVYRSVETGQVWARPLKMFVETVTVAGKSVPRFRKV